MVSAKLHKLTFGSNPHNQEHLLQGKKMENLNSLNSDEIYMILDHLGSQDLITFSQINQMSSQRVMEYVAHQLNKKDVGLKATMNHLDTIPSKNWSRLEKRLKTEDRRHKKIPSDLLTRVKKLDNLWEIHQTRKQIVHQKLPEDIHFSTDLITARPLNSVTKRVNCKGLDRNVIKISDRFRIEKSMGEITPGEFVFSLDIMCDRRTRFVRPEAHIVVRILDQNAVQGSPIELQTMNWTINLRELENYSGPSENVKRIHKNWFKITTNMSVNVSGTVVYKVLFNTFICRRPIYIDAITISRV